MHGDNLVADCLRGLRAALPPGTELRVREAGPPGEEPLFDGWIELAGPCGALEIPFEGERRVTPAALALINRRLREDPGVAQQEGPGWILFTEYVATHRAQELRDEGLAFADAQGNVHLHAPGLYVWVTGNRPPLRKQRTPRLVRPAPARVLFALLQQPDRVQAPYRELAALAGVAPDTVRLVYEDLQAKGMLKVWGKRKRALTRLREIVELWTVAYEEALRPKLQPQRVQWATGRPVGELAGECPRPPPELTVLLGGDVAAAVMTDLLRPATATLHVPPGERRAAMKALPLIPRPDGDLTLLDTFGETNRWPHPADEATTLVDPLLVHAELMRENDDRARTVAARIYDQYIKTRFPDDR